MSEQSAHHHPRPGSDEYNEHVREEIEHYGRVYQEESARQTLMQPVPRAWIEAETRAAALVRQATGDELMGHLQARLAARPNSRMLSLGSGPGGIELHLAALCPAATIRCMDINPDLLRLGGEQARQRGLAVEFAEADLNTVDLPEGEFDVVFCHAALHHVIELERLLEQIGRALRPGGVFITVDVVTRNGYLMWPETRQVVHAIWQALPPRYRLNHTVYPAPLIDDQIWEADTSAGGMECIRSEEILPAIDRSFRALHFVPYFSISRRFLDTMYGPNYDLDSPLDKAVFDWIWQMDLHYLASRRLRPETFFGIYRPA